MLQPNPRKVHSAESNQKVLFKLVNERVKTSDYIHQTLLLSMEECKDYIEFFIGHKMQVCFKFYCPRG